MYLVHRRHILVTYYERKGANKTIATRKNSYYRTRLLRWTVAPTVQVFKSVGEQKAHHRDAGRRPCLRQSPSYERAPPQTSPPSNPYTHRRLTPPVAGRNEGMHNIVTPGQRLGPSQASHHSLSERHLHAHRSAATKVSTSCRRSEHLQDQ